MFQLKFNQPFSSNSEVDEFDVRQIKCALNYLGYYTPLESTGLTNIPDRAIFDALKGFQSDRGLQTTGTAKPGDETEKVLNKDLKAADGEARYIWRTAGDGKVRSSHAALEGQERTLGDFLDPGEEFNCRCSAEPVADLIRDEKHRDEVCLDNWERKERLEQELESLRDQKKEKEKEKLQKEEEIERLRQEIKDIIGFPTPDLSGMDLDEIMKILDKIINRAELVIKAGHIISILQKIEQLEGEIEGLNKGMERLDREIQKKWDEFNDALESFNLLCPDFFGEA